MKDGWASHLITSLLTALVGRPPRPPPAILACLCVHDVNDFIRMSLETCCFFHAPMPRQSSPSPKQTLHLSLPGADSHACHELHTLRPTIPRVAAQPARARPPWPHPGSSPPRSLPLSLHLSLLPPWFLPPRSLRVAAAVWARVSNTWVGGWTDGEAARRWACHHTISGASDSILSIISSKGGLLRPKLHYSIFLQ